MAKKRVVETDEGIQGEFDVGMYDRMMRRMRGKLPTPTKSST
jgi:hypothetical protein